MMLLGEDEHLQAIFLFFSPGDVSIQGVFHPGPAIGGHFPDLGGVPAQSKKDPVSCETRKELCGTGKYRGHSYQTDIISSYNDLTATSLESWLIREVIPKWP